MLTCKNVVKVFDKIKDRPGDETSCLDYFEKIVEAADIHVKRDPVTQRVVEVSGWHPNPLYKHGVVDNSFVFTEGTVYVMNEKGHTVGTYGIS